MTLYSIICVLYITLPSKAKLSLLHILPPSDLHTVGSACSFGVKLAGVYRSATG